jgi:hypothetical protein
MGFSALTGAKTDDNGGFSKPLPYVFAARRTVGRYRADEEVRGLKTAAAVLEVRARACPAEPVDRVEGPDIRPQCRQCAIQQDVVPGVEQRRGQCARFPD